MRVGRHKLDLRTLNKVRRDVKHRVLGLPWLRPEPNDCFLASWPRSGNTWLRHMMFFHFYPELEADMPAIDRKIPVIDSVDLQRDLGLLAGAPIRMIKTHERAAPYFLDGRVVYLVRDGRDATFSWYHFRRNLYGDREDFAVFLDRCLRDKYRYQSWHRNVSGWLQYRNHPNMMIVRYEDFIEDPRVVLESVLRFVGVEVDAARVASVIEKSSRDAVGKSFQSMVQARKITFSGTTGGRPKERWRETFTPGQLAQFNAVAGDTLAALGYPLD